MTDLQMYLRKLGTKSV